MKTETYNEWISNMGYEQGETMALYSRQNCMKTSEFFSPKMIFVRKGLSMELQDRIVQFK